MEIIKHFYRHPEEKTFIQVGANDGKTKGDFVNMWVRKYNWRGIVVEPIPYLFRKLKKNYADCGGIFFENVAVAETDRDRDFYLLQGNEESSALQMVHEKILINKHRVKKIRVKCATLHQLLDRYEIDPDVIVIDAEGYDYKIIKTIDFKRIRPDLIIYEHRMLPHAKGCKRYLKGLGYKMYPFANNTAAYRTHFYKG